MYNVEDVKKSKRKFWIKTIVFVIFAFFFLKGYLGETETQRRNNFFKTYPFFEALNKIAPEEFEKFYGMLSSIPSTANEETKKELTLKAFLSARVWFDSNLGRLLKSASDDAVNEFGKHTFNLANTMLDSDPSGVYCFNVLYPGVIGSPDVVRLDRDFKDFPTKRSYLNSIADSISIGLSGEALSIEQLDEALAVVADKLIKDYGDDYYHAGNPKELANQPNLGCKLHRDFYKHILELDPHHSAGVIRYINTPE